jgi:hypothetical protein
MFAAGYIYPNSGNIQAPIYRFTHLKVSSHIVFLGPIATMEHLIRIAGFFPCPHGELLGEPSPATAVHQDQHSPASFASRAKRAVNGFHNPPQKASTLRT